MRLTAEQIDIIKQTVAAVAGPGVQPLLYGSRVRDDARGGDIDLLLEADTAVNLLQRAQIKTLLEQRLDMPVDVIAIRHGEPVSPFQQIARESSIPL